MGAALTSLGIVFGYAGISAVVVLVLILVSRRNTERRNRNLIQRIPLLVPAITFLVVSLMVYNYVPLPINEFSRTNTLYFAGQANYTEAYAVEPPGGVFLEDVQLNMYRYLSDGEFMRAEFRFYQGTTLVATEIVELNGTGVGTTQEVHELIDLDPGSYTVQVNTTFYNYGVPQDDILEAYITQLKADSVSELLNWSNYQFFLNIFTVVFLFGSFCIATEAPDRTSKYAKKPDAEFRTYDEQSE